MVVKVWIKRMFGRRFSWLSRSGYDLLNGLNSL